MQNSAKIGLKFPDEIWNVSVDWTLAIGANAVVGTPVVTPAGLTVTATVQNGNLTVITFTGGGPAYDPNARLELLATISSGEKLGFNVLVTVTPR
jgi:hypothetical protein